MSRDSERPLAAPPDVPDVAPAPASYFEPKRIRTRKTERCGRCRYPLSVCPCDRFAKLATRTHLAIVAHHIELGKTTNSSRLAVHGIEGAVLRARGIPGERETPDVPEGRRLVLYPGEGARVLGPDDAPRPDGPPVWLMVPDGTWSQTSRIVRRDPWLAGGERVCLPPHDRVGRYVLRSTQRENAASTLEAIAVALGVLEGPAVRDHLLAIFDDFVDRMLTLRRS